MNYCRIYLQLMSRAKLRVNSVGYVEQHHIRPRCVGGSNDVDNLVLLTPEEHFLAHQLLVKMHPDTPGLAWAAIKMCGNPWGKRSGNKAYGWLRRKHSLDTSVRMIGNKYACRVMPEEERKRRSEIFKAKFQANPRPKDPLKAAAAKIRRAQRQRDRRAAERLNRATNI